MDQKGLRHIILFSRLQKSHHRINRRVFVMMAAIAGIGLLINTAGIKCGLRKHEPEGMAVGVSGLTDACDSGHMTAHTTAEGVNAVHRTILHCRMTAFTQAVLK